MATLTDLIVALGSGAMAWKLPVRLVSASNRALSGLAAIDSVTPDEGDRVLLAAQTDPKQNGVYIASAGTWARAADFDSDADAKLGTTIMVLQGTTYALTIWTMTSPTTGTVRLGSDSLTWTRWAMTGASNAPAIVASASGSHVSLREGTTEVLRASDDSGASLLQGRGTSTRLEAFDGSLDLTCESGSTVRVFEAATQIAEFSDQSGVGRMDLVGSSGGSLRATVGDLTVDCAATYKIKLREGGTTVCDIYDAAGTRHIDFPAGAIIDNTAGFTSIRASSSFVALEGNDVYLNADTIHFRSEAGTEVGGIAAGVWTLGTGSSYIHAINGSTQTTVGAAGAASAPPATPDGYLRMAINGTTKKIPYYAD